MKPILIFICMAFLFGCNLQKEKSNEKTIIAFGSCGNQDISQPVLGIAADIQPDAFIFLGDNIYGDTDNMDTLRNKYKRWGNQSNYKKLAATTKIFATWDDHDYGRNDSGHTYPFKEESKEIFMNHFNIDKDDEMRKHKGIYHTRYVEKGEKKVQIILLDVRTFRSEVVYPNGKEKLPRKKYFYKLDYVPAESKDSTLLGEEQWKWLERELKKPADVRLICSGSQFGIEYNGYEAWANFPYEQKRMIELIKTCKSNGVIFLTGDVHYAELSKLNHDGLYPIYDVTASGITSTWDFATLNKNRIEGPVMENHFGLLTIDWKKDPSIKMEIIDHTKNGRIDYTIPLSEISFR